MIYRLPPKFSKDITNLNVRILSFAPLVASALGFWMFGNRQLFGYEVDEKLHKNELVLSHHILGTNRLMPVEIIFLISFIIMGALIVLLRPKSEQESLPQVPIPDYLEALKDQDLQEFVDEEYELQEKFGIVNLSR